MPKLLKRTPPPPPGIYYDVEEPVYRAWDAWNWSDIKMALWSLERCHHVRLYGQKMNNDALRIGRLFHCALFEPDELSKRWVVKPAVYPTLERVSADCGYTVNKIKGEPSSYLMATGRGKERVVWALEMVDDVDGLGGYHIESAADHNKPFQAAMVRLVMSKWTSNAAWCERWVTTLPAGVEVATLAEITKAKQQSLRHRELPCNEALFEGASFEVSMVWVVTLKLQNEEIDVTCKGRLDLLKGSVIADGKSMAETRRGEWVSFANQVYAFKYHGQAAFYLDGLFATGRIERPETPCFKFLGVEGVEPYAPVVYNLIEDEGGYSSIWLTAGRSLYLGLLTEIALAIKNDFWPSPNVGPGGVVEDVELGVPEYILKKLDTGEWQDG